METDTAVKQHPQVGEVFELELDADAPENTPLGMLEVFGCNPDGWDFIGTPLTGKCRGKFKLVRIGYQPNLDAAKTALEAKHGPTPSGQMMGAFNDAYPQADGNGPVNIADASWVDPDGRDRFPCRHSDGKPHFYWTEFNLGAGWCWLVAVPEDEGNNAETEN